MADDPSTSVRAAAILRPMMSPVRHAAGESINCADELDAEPRWRSDLRLFAITFAAGSSSSSPSSAKPRRSRRA